MPHMSVQCLSSMDEELRIRVSADCAQSKIININDQSRGGVIAPLYD